MSPINDGYDGHWEPRRRAEEGAEDITRRDVPVGKWPMEITKTKSTTLFVSKGDSVWKWTCKECEEVMVTATYNRPHHMCSFRKKEEE